MGRIGEAVAHRLAPFGIRRIMYWGRQEKPDVEKRLPMAQFTGSLDTLLAESDFVIVCCALTPETRELFNYDAFNKMKDTAVSILHEYISFIPDLNSICT